MNKKPIFVIFLTVFMDLVGFGLIIPLNPYLAREFGASALEVGLLMTIFSLCQFVFAPFWGQLSDRYGRRPIILTTVLGTAMAHLLFANSSTLLGLFLARALAGFFGGNISVAMAAIADITPPEERTKGMGIIGAAFGLGFILGPFLGGILGDLGPHISSAPPFGENFAALVASGLSLVNFLLAYRIFPETRPAVGVLAREKSSRLLLLWENLRRPVVSTLLLAYFCSGLAMAHMEASLFLVVQDRFAWTLTQASLGFAYVGVVLAFTQGFLIRRLLKRMGERSLAMLGLFLMGVGFFGIAFAGTIPVIAVAVTSLGIGNGLLTPSLTGAISLLTKAEHQGRTMGVSQSVAALARILGPASGGWLYAHMGSAMPFNIAAALAIIGCVLLVRVPPIAKSVPGTAAG